MINLLSITLESVETLGNQYQSIFRIIEVSSIIIFTTEYLLRLYSSDYNKMSSGGQSRIKYALSFMAIIDLLAILPFYIPVKVLPDLRFLRGLRMFRTFRVFRMLRFSNSLNLMWRVLKNERRNLLITTFAMVIMLIISAFLMYEAEHTAQPDAFASIFHSLWWAVATLTTVGYGDVYPITVLGKIISSFVALLGIALVAMPSGIIASGFMSEISNNSQESNNIDYCPYCGKDLKKHIS
jgi:voltage-gated potassium channel